MKLRHYFVTALACLVFGCGTDPTQLLIEVDTDFDVPTQLSRIELRTFDETGALVAVAPFEVTPHDADPEPGKYVLPVSFAIVPKDDDLDRLVLVQLSGYLGQGTDALVMRRARIGFVEGRTIPLRLFLAQACQGVVCEGDTTCDRGVCIPVDVVPPAGSDGGADSEMSVDMGVNVDLDASMPMDADDVTDSSVDTDAVVACTDSNETRCDGVCVNTHTTPSHCGSCAHACTAGQVCNADTCEDVAVDCRTDGSVCTGDSYCDASTGLCASGCADTGSCGVNETCNAAHACVCASDYHDCGGTCSSRFNTASCGASCAACATDAHGTTGCDGTSCTLTCADGFMLSGASCVPIPVTRTWHIETATGVSGYTAQLAVGSDDVPRVTYSNGAAKFAQRYDTGWFMGTIDTADSPHTPAITIAADGEAHVLYRAGTGSGAHDMRYGVHTATGWVISEIPTMAIGDDTPSIAIDSTGAPIVAYPDTTMVGGSGYQSVFYGRLASGTWSRSEIGQANTYNAYVRVLSDGRVISIYEVYGNELRTRARGATTWGSYDSLHDFQFDSMMFGASAGAGAKAAVVFGSADEDGGPRQLYAAFGTWSSGMRETNLSLFGAMDAAVGIDTTSADIGIDADGVAVIAFYDVSARDLRVAHLTSAGDATFETVDSTGDVGARVRMIVGPTGNLHLIYADVTHNTWKYAVYR